MMKIENQNTGTEHDLTLVFLTGSTAAASLIRASLETLKAGNYTVWLVCVESITADNISTTAEALITELSRTGFKRASIIALDEACAVAQVLLSRNAQIVRRAVFVNPISRARASLIQQALEFWQHHWAIPLPFRLRRGTFDIRHIQHRVACPLLIIKTAEANDLSIEACTGLAERAPSSWLVELPSVQTAGNPPQLSDTFLGMIREFIEVPSKRSQKNLGASKKQPPNISPDTERKAA